MQDTITQLRNYCFNINNITDIDTLIDLFSQVNSVKLDNSKRNTLSDCVLFLIDQTTDQTNIEGEPKLKYVKDIVENYIYNNLNVSYYHYYLTIRESMRYERNDLNIILSNLLEEELSFLNEIQKLSFISFLKNVKLWVQDQVTIDALIEKISQIKVAPDQPEFAPSKIKQLEQENKSLQEELATINYVLMMQNML